MNKIKAKVRIVQPLSDPNVKRISIETLPEGEGHDVVAYADIEQGRIMLVFDLPEALALSADLVSELTKAGVKLQ